MPIVLRRAFLAAALAWAALLVAVPYIASRAPATSPGTVLVVAVYGIGSLVCHQLPERSWRLWTAQMPVCARCAGIYGGAAAASVLLLAWRVRSSVQTNRARIAVALAALPSLATLVYEWTTGVTPSNALRFAAGIPIGVVVARLIVSAAEDQVN
jgi:uncharacterized membrane protein